MLHVCIVRHRDEKKMSVLLSPSLTRFNRNHYDFICDEIFCIQIMNTFEIHLTKCAWTRHVILIDLSQCVEITVTQLLLLLLQNLRREKIRWCQLSNLSAEEQFGGKQLCIRLRNSHIQSSQAFFHLTFFAISISHLNTIPCMEFIREMLLLSDGKSKINDGKYLF